MKIVILDGYTTNPGDLSWDVLKTMGDVQIYDRTPPDRVLEHASGADILLTNKTPLVKETLDKLPSLKYIGVLATGFNVVDTKAASENGIVVTNVPGYGTASVAQMTFALLLELCQHVQRHSDSVMSGKWARSVDWCYWDYPLLELSGKTMGVIGFGNIGANVGDIATAFGMNLIGSARHQNGQEHRTNFRWADVDALLEQSDVVTLHCPLLPETKGIINKESLKRMKKTAFLINTSRGPLINDEELADALNNDEIAGAALDVLSTEPPSPHNPLFKAKNCIITPHIAWATKEARSRLMDTATENVNAFLSGKPVNVVN